MINKFTTVKRRDTEWDEWQVRLYKNGEYVEDSSYHTSDEEDADITAEEMVRHAAEQEDYPDTIAPLKTYKFEVAMEVEATSEIQARALLRNADIEPDNIKSCTHYTPNKTKPRNAMTMQEELEMYGGTCIYKGTCTSGPWRYHRFLRAEWNDIKNLLTSKGSAGEMLMSASTAEVWSINECPYVWMKCRTRA